MSRRHTPGNTNLDAWVGDCDDHGTVAHLIITEAPSEAELFNRELTRDELLQWQRTIKSALALFK